MFRLVSHYFRAKDCMSLFNVRLRIGIGTKNPGLYHRCHSPSIKSIALILLSPQPKSTLVFSSFSIRWQYFLTATRINKKKFRLNLKLLTYFVLFIDEFRLNSKQFIQALNIFQGDMDVLC